jgi:hypothetical protein
MQRAITHYASLGEHALIACVNSTNVDANFDLRAAAKEALLTALQEYQYALDCIHEPIEHSPACATIILSCPGTTAHNTWLHRMTKNSIYEVDHIP